MRPELLATRVQGEYFLELLRNKYILFLKMLCFLNYYNYYKDIFAIKLFIIFSLFYHNAWKI